MGVAGTGSALGTQFDFTKMTNSGLLNAAHELGNEGKISSGDEAQLVGTLPEWIVIPPMELPRV